MFCCSVTLLCNTAIIDERVHSILKEGSYLGKVEKIVLDFHYSLELLK